jgi:hypothetical protein
VLALNPPYSLHQCRQPAKRRNAPIIEQHDAEDAARWFWHIEAIHSTLTIIGLLSDLQCCLICKLCKALTKEQQRRGNGGNVRSHISHH